ncbi:MAG: hypothetical protein ACLFVU_02490 [Phycisphaerae bacterium]
MKAVLLGAICLGLAVALIGCRPNGMNSRPEPPKPESRINQILLQSRATPVNLDEQEGPDGFAVRVFFFRANKPEPVTVSGTLEVLLFEGDVSESQVEQAPVYHKWTFPGSRLGRYLIKNVVGWGYSMQLDWGEKMPRTKAITLVARYYPPGGTPVASRPVTLAMSID